MKRKLAILICCAFLATGLIRIGVGGLMIGQLMGWWQIAGEAAAAVTETQRFIAEARANLVGFTALTYFVFILSMGLSISLGAIGQIWRRIWGLPLIGLYLLCHAFLFVNFMTINPKVALLGLAALLTIVLAWADNPMTRERALLAEN